MTQTIDDWRPFLERWSREWADVRAPGLREDHRGLEDEEPRRADRLGFPPASEERIGAAEERLGRRLPPSYRTFLKVSDGWRHAGGFVYLLAGAEAARWFEGGAGRAAYYPGELHENSSPEDVLLAGMWGRSLQLAVESDMADVLLDPGDVGDDGEWAVYSHASWRASPPKRYASFRLFMEDMYREFHRLTANESVRTAVAFANATTRAQDASVEAARLDALAGRHERASAGLAQAVSYGRPRAQGLLDQIHRLLGKTYMVYFPGLAVDPLYAPEVVPLLAAEHVRSSHLDDSAWGHRLRGATDPLREAADGILRQVRGGAFRYTAEGPFGRAVEKAREQALWGGTDEAWATLRAALPAWRPLGPDHLAPVGLCADPLLGPLITPERGAELLATPRAGEPGETPVPAPDADPPGLAWLAESGGDSMRAAYRFVLVEGVEPAELPGRLGADGTAAVLEGPMTRWESRRQGRSSPGSSTWRDEGNAMVGRAGPGWSFAFEAETEGFVEQWMVSPGTAASHGTRAVTVWRQPASGQHPAVFHLSCAVDGEERYAFTVRGTDVGLRGPVPDALDPERLFARDDQGVRRDERDALEAVAAEFGVRLPRFALERGRLHVLRTGPWRRLPREGERYATLSWRRQRP
ncbi:SMI1/KNR4 family protein [Streptomyces sp. NBC_01497]|uniref:SMI1/KNR4 family protein n=1 Tax=Streptomyces sp. NBC_01497 TaxID=2903885 RepID=UPI002E365328|nr:SMI1/KNR4 family protein [Streptomyces sp. NBC_01497]